MAGEVGGGEWAASFASAAAVTTVGSMMTRVMAVSALASFLAFSNAHAEPQKVLGFGTARCVWWTGERDHPVQTGAFTAQQWGDTQWIFGYLSALGYPGPTDASGELTADAAIETWIDKYCRLYPDATLAEAAEAYYVAHRREFRK
jgi:hypothetical protein